MTTTVTISDAQLKSGTSVVLPAITAAGTNKIAVPKSAQLWISGYIADYTNIAANAVIELIYDDGTPCLTQIDNSVNNAVNSLLAGGESCLSNMSPKSEVNGSDLFSMVAIQGSLIANLDVLLRIVNNAPGALTGGNAAQVLKVFIQYDIIDIS
jgi:hypothetical protein